MITNYEEKNVQEIRAFLKSKNLNEYAIAGVIGNLYAESRLRPDNLQNSFETSLGLTEQAYISGVNNGFYTNFATDRAGFGLCQWTSSGRKQRLLEFKKNVHPDKSIADMQLQLAYLWEELNGSYKSVLAALQAAGSVDASARVFMTKFERPANQTEANQLVRVGYAEEFYKKYSEVDMSVPMIVIDAGHYYYTAGKRCLKKIDPDETREWILNSRIADLLEEALKKYKCEVRRVDDTKGANDILLSERCKKANALNADIYISIHHNAGIAGGSGGGTVVFYYSNKAERESQAKDLYDSVVKYTGLAGNRSSKVVKKGYYVLANTKAPAFLLENGFMDSTTDTPVILSVGHAEKTVQGLIDFLIRFFDLVKNVTDPADDSFKVRISQDTQEYFKDVPEVAGTVKRNEVYTIVEESGNYGKLKSGAGWLDLNKVKRL